MLKIKLENSSCDKKIEIGHCEFNPIKREKNNKIHSGLNVNNSTV